MDGAHTQECVAAAMKLSRPHYSNIETGRVMINYNHLQALAGFYGISVAELVADDGPQL
ncbi:helix-turn-helix transcriptional regulator [Candidatus Bipolaricaulota bacterium]|nr:helix-turn-helix transcriptional regulator [Candidatus Bipolaricaulota bacterium]